MVEHDSCPATLTHASLPYQPTPWYYARIFYFHGLPDPSISFSNNEQIFFARISAAADVCEAKGRFDFAVGYNS
jgi:hypothetical protein